MAKTLNQRIWIVAQAIGNVVQCQSDEQCSNQWKWRTCSHCKETFRDAARAAIEANATLDSTTKEKR